MSEYIQLYSIDNILRTYKEEVTDRRLAIFDVGPENNYYFVKHKPYKFTSLGLILITKGTCEITVNLEPTLIKRDDIIIVLPSQLVEFLSSKYPKIISLDKKVVRDMRYNLNKISKYTIKNDNLFAKDLVLHHFSVLMYEMGDFYNRAVKAKSTIKEVRKEEKRSRSQTGDKRAGAAQGRVMYAARGCS